MQIQQKNINNPNFGLNFKLSKETVARIEKTTKLSYDEMTLLPLEKSYNLMKKRNSLKKTNKIKLWFAEKYRRFGEKMGLLSRPFYN